MDYAQDHPLISVIIPTKNRCSLLRESLESVRNQTYQHWEAVVLDDHSEDDTWPVLEDLARRDPRIRPVLRTGLLGGTAVARNQGFYASTGSFILFLDSDDLLAPTALEERIRAFCRFPEADAIVGDSEYFRNSPGEYHEECTRSSRLLDGVDPLDAFLTSVSLWCTSGPLWKRTAVEKAGPWRNSYDNQYHTYALVLGLRFIRVGVIDWFIRNHNGPQVSRYFISNFLDKIESLDATIQLLQTSHLLSRRRRRMLAWRCLLETLTCAYNRALPNLKDTLSLWSEASERKIFGTSAYVLGVILTSLQSSRLTGPAPRELVRLFIYCDLRRLPVHTKEFRISMSNYLKYLAIHFRSWTRANGHKATNQTL